MRTRDAAGHYLLLDFWATWCAPCVADMKYVHRAHERYPDLDILSVSMDSSPNLVTSFRRHWPMPWLHGFAGDHHDEIWKRFEVDGIPYMILVSPEGTILAAGSPLRGEGLLTVLKKQLGARP